MTNNSALENFTAEIKDVLENCGIMKPYVIKDYPNVSSNQIILEAVWDDMLPYRVIITIEEI